MFQDLFAEIEKSHSYEFTDTPSLIDEFEKQCGYELPKDLKDFYHRYKTVKLFDNEGDASYRFVPVNEMKVTGYDIYGDSANPDEFPWPKTWFTICDVLDGNYIAIDLSSKNENEWNYIDCFHETYGVPGESEVIAKSFTELLEQSLRGGRGQFYLEKGFKSYGNALEITPETAIRRVEPIISKWGWLGELIRQRKYHHIQSGWYVEFVKPRKGCHKFFADKDYSGKEKAFMAAKEYLEENKK